MSSTLPRFTLTGTILFAAAVLLTACATNAGTDAGEPIDPVGTWGDATTRTEPSLGLASDGALTGTDGCNRLVGSWSDDGETITFEDVASTRMACPDVETWLSDLATGTISGETLTVFDADGAEIGTLDRSSDEDPSMETSGDATAFLGTWGTEGETGQPFLTIAEAGAVNGNDGCNSLAGSWSAVDDVTIEFSEVAQTLMACEGVDTWLSGLSTATVGGDTLTLYDASGTEIGTLPRTA